MIDLAVDQVLLCPLLLTCFPQAVEEAFAAARLAGFPCFQDATPEDVRLFVKSLKQASLRSDFAEFFHSLGWIGWGVVAVGVTCCFPIAKMAYR